MWRDARNWMQVFTVKGEGHEGPEGEYRYSCTLSLTSALDGDGWSSLPPGPFTTGNDPVPIVLQGGWAPGPVWTGAENLAPSWVRSLDLQTRSESLYHRRRPGSTSLYGFRDNSTSLEAHTERSSSNSCAPLFTESKFSFLQSLLLMSSTPHPTHR